MKRRTFIKLFTLLNFTFFSNINFSSYLKQNKFAFSKFKGFIVTSDQKKILKINT